MAYETTAVRLEPPREKEKSAATEYEFFSSALLTTRSQIADPSGARSDGSLGADEKEIFFVDLPRPTTPRVSTHANPRLVVLQKWGGFVESIDQDAGTFVGRLNDIHSPAEGNEERAEFYLDDVSPDDMELLRQGAIFSWIIGYRDQLFTPRERVSSIVFRRLPAWSRKDLREARETGRTISNALRWE